MNLGDVDAFFIIVSDFSMICEVYSGQFFEGSLSRSTRTSETVDFCQFLSKPLLKSISKLLFKSLLKPV